MRHAPGHTCPVSSLTADRVRSDVDVLSRAGLGLEDFLEEATESVGRAVPWVAACVATHDPTTRIISSARKYGDLVGHNDQDTLFARIEYGGEEPTAFQALHGTNRTAVAMHVATGGEVERSARMAQLMKPYYGYLDETRMLFADGDSYWGSMAIFRGPDDPAFSAAEAAWIAELAPAFARGVRIGILAAIGLAGTPADVTGLGPAVIILGADDRVSQMSPAAQARLDQLLVDARTGDPLTMVTALAASARRLARGEISTPPRVRVRATDGEWLVMHASPLSNATGGAGDVVITIEAARPPEIIDLVVAAFDLTAREREVTKLVIQGADTKEIAAALFLSPYTVQDHLRSIFDKAGVRSRRELVARVYFDQYAPRMNATLAPSGGFAAL